MVKPTLRMKRRYVGFRIIGKDAERVEENILRNSFRLTLLRLFGEIGSSASGYKFISYDKASKIGIVRFERDFVLNGIAMFSFIETLKGFKGEARPVPLATSGSLKRLKTKLGITNP